MARVVRAKRAVPKVNRSRPNKKIFDDVEEIPLSDLNPYYKNPRIGDVEKVAESLHENGQFKPIVVNKGNKTGRPNEILAGNHTWLAANKLRWDTIAVGWVDVDEEHARRIVLADNGTSDGSTYDDAILSQLLEEQKTDVGTLVGTTYNEEILDKLLIEINQDPLANVERIEDAPTDLAGVADLNNFVFFDSTADFDIPQLQLDMIPQRLPEPLDVWAGHEVDLERQQAHPDMWWLAQWHAGMRGVNWEQCIAMLYTEDFHFTACYDQPAENTKKILNLGMTMAIMPNYSVNPTWPIATWIWAVYRSFYVGRYWQEAGIQVIPDIQYGTNDDALALSLLGIPEGAPVVAAQVQNARGDMQKVRTTARLLKAAEDQIGWNQILLYGHTDADRVLEYADLKSDVVRVSNRSARRREYLNSGSTINSQKIPGKKKKQEDV